MAPPVRSVCGSCLQSLETSSGDSATASGPCPFCGYQPGFYGAGPGSGPGSDTPTGVRAYSPNPMADVGSDGPTMHLDVEPDPPTDPDRIGRFLIREPLGEGGYGEVYRAYDPHLQRDVALKVLKATRLNEKAIERFFREARAAARLDHPNIVALHDAGRDEGRCWIAYQLVSGRTLSQIRDRDRPSPAEAVRIVRDLAEALDHAHSRGVFHRDLKPANVMIDDSGRVRLTDFGLARRIDLSSDLTREGTVLGTPHYMSPEAAAGRSHEADGRSDIYSLGVILYELLCRRKPTDLPSDSPPWRFKPNPIPPTPRSVDRAIPVALDRICMRALAHKPDDRYPDGRSLADALSSQIAPLARGKAPSAERSGSTILLDPLPVEPAPPARKPRLAVAAAVMLVALAGAGALAWRNGATAPTTPPQASNQSLLAPDVASGAPPTQKHSDFSSQTRVLGDPGHPKAAPVESGKATPEVDANPLIASRESKRKVYHRGDCSSVRSISEANQVRISSANEAREMGYKACKICNP